MFVGVEHFIGSRIRKDSVEKNWKIDGKSYCDCERDPEIETNPKLSYFNCKETAQSTNWEKSHEKNISKVVVAIHYVSINKWAEKLSWSCFRILSWNDHSQIQKNSKCNKYKISIEFRNKKLKEQNNRNKC